MHQDSKNSKAWCCRDEDAYAEEQFWEPIADNETLPSRCIPQLQSLFLFLFFFLGPSPWHMEVPRLGDKAKLQLLASTKATTTQDPNLICDLYHSSWQCQIPNPMSGARDWTRIFMDTSRFPYHWATTGAPPIDWSINSGASWVCLPCFLFQ